jgi:hypothetical protein
VAHPRMFAANQALEEFFGSDAHAMPDHAASHRKYERAAAAYGQALGRL